MPASLPPKLSLVNLLSDLTYFRIQFVRKITDYSEDKFSTLAKGRSAFHLPALEATFIKSFDPNLCRQKEFVYGLKIIH